MRSFATQRSIRFRLTVGYASALAAGLVLFALTIWFSMWRSLIQDIDVALQARVNSVESFLNAELRTPGVHLDEELEEYSQGFPPNSILLIQDQGGARVFSSTPTFPWPVQSGRHGRTVWNKHAYRLLTKPISAQEHRWTVSLAAPLDAADHLLQRLGLLLLALIPAVVGVSALGGNWLSRRALKPVDDITQAARSVGIENLSNRLVVPQTGDELQRLSETWNSMLGRLEGAVQRLVSFTADASHELRTPLAVIRGTAEIAGRKPRTAESYCRSLTEIVAEAERMTQTVEDLLFLARGDAGIIDFPKSRIELGGIVANVCARMATLADCKGLRMHVEFPPKPIEVLASDQAIQRLLLILLDNAVKYSKDGGEVVITLNQQTDEVRLEVSDSGPGIPDAELPRIFERFYRSAFARQTGQGSGLGLSLAADIARHHGATIQVASRPNEGAVFTVVFPLPDAPSASQQLKSGMYRPEQPVVGADSRQ